MLAEWTPLFRAVLHGSNRLIAAVTSDSAGELTALKEAQWVAVAVMIEEFEPKRLSAF